jgi:hypothetical protein
LNPSLYDNLVFFHFVLKEALRNAEHIGCMGLNVITLAQGPLDQLFLDLFKGLL